MTREERENAIRCLKIWIEREPYIQTYKTCLEALEQEPSKDMEEIEEVINCDADAEIKLKMISNIVHSKSHYFKASHEDKIIDEHYWKGFSNGIRTAEWRATKQEPAYCDRNICIKNEYNGVGCDECEVTKSQEPCEDCISRRALLKLMGEEPFNWTDSDQELQEVEDYRNFRDMVEQLPSVKPQERTGHWEWVQYDYNPKIGNWHCTECRCIVVECVDKNEKGGIPLYKYCPQCGAKMEVEKNG